MTEHYQKTDINQYVLVSELKGKDTANIVGWESECIINDQDFDNSEKKREFARNYSNLNFVADCSINGSTGIEMTTPPFSIKNKNHVKEIKDAITKLSQNASVNSSCGFHVHFYINPVNQYPTNLKKLLLAFIKVEEIFFAIQPDSRQSSRYCRKFPSLLNADELHLQEMLKSGSRTGFSKAYYALGNMSAKRSKERLEAIKCSKYVTQRYYWVNFHSLNTTPNTLEFRNHSGTLSFDKMYNYTKMIRNYLKYVLSGTPLKISTIANLTNDETYNIIFENDKSLMDYYVARYNDLHNTTKTFEEIKQIVQINNVNEHLAIIN